MKSEEDYTAGGNRILKAFTECKDALVRNLLKHYVRAEDVDDILQTTFLRALEADRKRGIASPKDYLFVVSRNMVFKSMSARSREMRAEVDEILLEADEPEADIALYYRLKLQAFDEALSALPEAPRQAIILRKFLVYRTKKSPRKWMSRSALLKNMWRKDCCAAGTCCEPRDIRQKTKREKKRPGIVFILMLKRWTSSYDW